ncbi:MAG: multifunctional oxoglutarate decarboxylase/oxoglutarate dehydrogenase thiamine pyrophosphate-binding subunit/dihydrolipoyllysine-residue succinyltransferase subunit, partial [Bacteroidetes bacterium]|nr:multifunctional oxoglutarate decarboxylase/oxoglutarate dehydrogenase thiamine pyrophosphate-binding subunit/dihydrolipoyllysine-residue succinyltransferase subunit [Bacteroidota bacterium]
EELYRQFLEDPDSVSESWREFFADFIPSESFVLAQEHRQVLGAVKPERSTAPATLPPGLEAPEPSAPAAPEPSAPAAPEPTAPAAPEPTAPAAPEPAAPARPTKPIRGAAAKVVENMEASLAIPTATSVRHIPVKLMVENRRLLNEYQRQIGGEKVSFTHIIAFAIVKGLVEKPNLNTTYTEVDEKPVHVLPESINLGLAIDVERRGKRTLMVPNIPNTGNLSFGQLLGAYNDIVRRARSNQLQISDFEGTTVTITNPGVIGTDLSVPRLMPKQGTIIGIGSIDYPTQYYAFPPDVMSKTGISQVMTITSTYDHRVIQGAESGAFLAHIEQLLRGEHGFYEAIFSDLKVPYQPFTLAADTTPQMGSTDGASELDMIHKQARVLQLIRAFRVRGHLQADVNPLGYDWTYHDELDPMNYGLTIWDLDREFVTGGLGSKDVMPLRDILDIIRTSYTRQIGTEFMHISDPGEREWIQNRVEATIDERSLTDDEKRRMLEKLNAAEAFETFLHTKYVGHKRFSLEGSETIIPLLDRILSDAAETSVDEVVIGMAHRGRLNVLANILNKPYEVIFSEFEGSLDPNTIQGSGDVKYHLGAFGEHTSPGGDTIQLVLASNPSHLEAVNPVVEGMVRAKQEALRGTDLSSSETDYEDSVIPILIHGDAAFAGQGVVAETLNMSQLPGYHTGGTIHLVINNQIGFTTGPSEARSSTYATDIARMIQAPIFHVNGDDPESCVRVARIALDYRQAFNKDVVVDMLCYRVRGHNEGDEPSYTQPLLYQKIETKRPVRKIYTELLLRRGDMSPEAAEKMLDDYRGKLQDAFESTKELDERVAPVILETDEQPQDEFTLPDIPTACPRESLVAVVTALNKFPDAFIVHKKLDQQFQRRQKQFFDDQKVDWGLAEALAFGTLLLDGTRIRMSGQDTRRGTFSHRHAVVYDQKTNEEYVPLNHVADEQGILNIYDSLLSEYAACGFEYGYSVAEPDALVIWEAQFGDFGNGAQIIFDQFLSCAEEKWGQTSSLVLLLPHGYEGQGPEHSSARLERFLQMSAEGNMIVCNFTTPANYFHALRRQASDQITSPLIVMAPKSLLRHPLVISHPDELNEGRFLPVIGSDLDADSVEKVILCSGKVYYDLMNELKKDDDTAHRIAVCRLEQIYPFPFKELQDELSRYPQLKNVVWLQEEPENMGAWSFVRHRIDHLLESVGKRVEYAGRVASASTATGSALVHHAEQSAILAKARSG